MADDEDMARSYLAEHGDQPARPPRVAEWNPLRAELANITDRLAELIGAVIAVNGGKPPQLQPRPRPVTALDRVRHTLREEQHNALVLRLLPNGPRPLPEPSKGGEST